MDGDGDVDCSGLAVQLCRFVFPLLDGIDGRLMEQGGTGDNMDGADIAVCVDEDVDLHVTRHILGFGGCRIDGRNRFEQAGLLEVSADWKRSGGLLAMASG